MPRTPLFTRVGWENDDMLLEFTMYFDYSKQGRDRKFEVRARMTIRQVKALGGMDVLHLRMDDMLQDIMGIQTDEFDKTTIGIRNVEGQPTKYGEYKIHDVYGAHVYPEGDKWGSLKYLWT